MHPLQPSCLWQILRFVNNLRQMPDATQARMALREARNCRPSVLPAQQLVCSTDVFLCTSVVGLGWGASTAYSIYYDTVFQ
jgi:hypothetical protein